MNTLRYKIAQMLVMGFSGIEISATHRVAKWIKEEGIGGVILFNEELNHPETPKNLVDKVQIIKLTQSLKELAAQHAKAKPLLIAVDYEGGEVDRLKNIPGCPKTLKPVEMANLDKQAMVKQFINMAQTLKSLGFNLNFAPVVDLAFNVEGDIIGQRGRSFSTSPQKVIEVAQLFVQTFIDQGVHCCYKHFPGHGSARGDTHLGFVDVTETYDASELVPYQQLTADLGMIMTAHVVNRHLDSTGLPATLSKQMLTRLLRDELAFDGVIISDDMQMRAIAALYPLEKALALTINAGADMLIFGNQWGEHDATMLIDQIEGLVNRGEIPEIRIEEAYSKITKLKTTLTV